MKRRIVGLFVAVLIAVVFVSCGKNPLYSVLPGVATASSSGTGTGNITSTHYNPSGVLAWSNNFETYSVGPWGSDKALNIYSPGWWNTKSLKFEFGLYGLNFREISITKNPPTTKATIIYDLCSFAAWSEALPELVEWNTYGFALKIGNKSVVADSSVGSVAGQIEYNTWYELATTYDVVNNISKTYLNGTLIGTRSISLGSFSWPTQLNKIYLCQVVGAGSSGAFAIDNMKIYKN